MSTSSTVHAKGFWKNKPERGEVPLCTKWSPFPKGGVTTDDNSKINCKRCAKELNITPAPKRVSSTRGTCQGCFGAYETRQHAAGHWNVVLHGFKRPGHGWLVGECAGNGFVPYEVSCEQTKVFKFNLEHERECVKTQLECTVKNLVPTFTAQVRNGKRSMKNGWMQDEFASVEVPLGQGEIPNPYLPGNPWEKVHSYEWLRDREAQRLQGIISQMTATIEFLGEMITAWKPVAFPKVT